MLETLYGLNFHKQFLSRVVWLFIAEHGPASFLTSYLDGVVTSDSLRRPIFPLKKGNCTRSVTQHERDDCFFSWPSYYSMSWDYDLAWICHQRFVFSQGIGWLLFRRAWRTLFRSHRNWDPGGYTPVRVDFKTYSCWTPRCTCHCPWPH